jgi:hypothetical protein
MIPINNSDTAWLIVSDYNQDNDLPYEELREDVANPNVNEWSGLFSYHYCAELIFCSGEASGIIYSVGGYSWGKEVGNSSNMGNVGTYFHEHYYADRHNAPNLSVEADWSHRDGAPSLLVGGNRHGPR